MSCDDVADLTELAVADVEELAGRTRHCALGYDVTKSTFVQRLAQMRRRYDAIDRCVVLPEGISEEEARFAAFRK